MKKIPLALILLRLLLAAGITIWIINGRLLRENLPWIILLITFSIGGRGRPSNDISCSTRGTRSEPYTKVD
ncbi:MAG TPA: hypothetical protein VL547_10965 [Dinghuibacter sp.]|jgi:hypothetical protein|uniref:hypothetical protein n=1 Tax=Dinghuibacter sp. TaxID=2024697 RepID=UPI002BAEF3B2|nr:hypothetical protein [Dinghuibacter sp.]HTJ12540.1 hypothetical protein [Dinghuibacter sp.]